MPRPIRSPFTIPYGAQFGAARAGGKRRHNGTDYHCPVGTPIFGTGEGGRVLHIGYNGDPWMGLGHNVTILYPDGKTVDAHMQHRTPLWVGAHVGPNTLVGHVGITGNAVNASPPGSHLHHERRNNNGLLVNPEVYYGGSATPSGTPITPIEEDEDMPTYELVQTPDGTVWYCVDRVHRYGIPNEGVLNDYKFFIRSKGQSDAVTKQANADAYGSPVFRNGAPTIGKALTAAQIAAEVKKVIPTNSGGTSADEIAQKVGDVLAARLTK